MEKPVANSQLKFRPLQLENAFIIFAVIYFPVVILFLNRGLITTTLLIMYTFVMIVASIFLIARFVLFLARVANEGNNKFGSLFLMYVLNLLMPLVMLKVLAYVTLQLLPLNSTGLVCTAVNLTRGLYFLFQIQTSLSWLIWGSLIAMGAFILLVISKNK